MSGTKLDQSLDEILKTGTRGGRVVRGARRGRRAPAAGRTAAPVGGVKKSSKGLKTAVVPTGPAISGESRIQVSNLPKDVSEAQIKEYFIKSVGAIKKCELSYGPEGASRGICTIWFQRPDAATKAVEQLNGLLVDGRPMKIDVLVDARRAASLPQPKGLGDRISQVKSQPKSAAVTKTVSTATGAGTRGVKSARGRGRGGRNARPAKKTAAELDSEMADYWENSGNAPTAETAANGVAQPAGDAAMDDIL